MNYDRVMYIFYSIITLILIFICSIFTNYGYILQCLDKIKESEFLLKKAINIKGNSAAAYTFLGSAQRKLNKFTKNHC